MKFVFNELEKYRFIIRYETYFGILNRACLGDEAWLRRVGDGPTEPPSAKQH